MPGGARVSSVDWWRGFALVTIFVNHVPGNALENYTHKNFGLSDASELFVLLAGMAASFAYLPLFWAGRGVFSTLKMVLRAFHVYVMHIAILCLAGAIVVAATLQMEDSRIAEAMQFDLFLASPAQALIGFVTLGHQPNYLNILPLYVVLLLMAPLLMLGLRVNAGVTLAASGALYLATQLFDLRLPSYPGEGAWFFNPLAWQFLYVIGLVLGDRLRSGRPVQPPLWLVWASVAVLAGALVWVRSGVFLDHGHGLPRFMWDLDKTNLSLPRLVHVLALVVVVSRLPLEQWISRSRALQPFVLLGRHSLGVFGLGTVLAILAQTLRIAVGGEASLDVLMITTGLVLQMLLAWALEWNRNGALARAASPAAALARSDL
ncbi:MAG: OpgC domain-containing protein [Alsobacter sp.]